MVSRLRTKGLILDSYNHGKNIEIKSCAFHEWSWIDYIQDHIDCYNDHMVAYGRDAINPKLVLKQTEFDHDIS